MSLNGLGGAVHMIRALQTELGVRLDAMRKTDPHMRGLEGALEVERCVGWQDCIEFAIALLKQYEAQNELNQSTSRVN